MAMMMACGEMEEEEQRESNRKVQVCGCRQERENQF